MASRDFETTSETLAPSGEHRIRLRVPPDLRYFEGHFDGRPMLPGVAQVVALADHQARKRVPGLGAAVRLQRVKFTAVVGPGEELVLSLTEERRDGEVRVRWQLERVSPASGEVVASSGTLVYLPG